MRLLLVGFGIATGAFYLLFVRPTELANKFAGVVAAQDVKLATTMLNSDDETSIKSNFSDAVCHPEVQPRTWSDVWHCRRRITVLASVPSSSGVGMVFQQQSTFEAGPFRVRFVEKAGTYYF